eukprot:g2654.t1
MAEPNLKGHMRRLDPLFPLLLQETLAMRSQLSPKNLLILNTGSVNLNYCTHEVPFKYCSSRPCPTSDRLMITLLHSSIPGRPSSKLHCLSHAMPILGFKLSFRHDPLDSKDIVKTRFQMNCSASLSDPEMIES